MFVAISDPAVAQDSA